MTLRQRLADWNDKIESGEGFVISLLSRLTTWGAPLVPAIFVYSSAKEHIANVAEPQALVIAAVIELLGLSVVSNWLDVKEFNRQADEQGRVSEAGTGWMLFFYVATVLCIVFGLKIAPDAFLWLALLSLSLMSLWSAVAFVQRRQHAARLDELRAGKAEQEDDKMFDKQLDRELRLAEHRRRLADIEPVKVVDKSSDNDKSPDNDNDKRLRPGERRELLLTKVLTFHSPDEIDHAGLASELDVSERTIYRDIDALIEAGRLSLNGSIKPGAVK